METNHRILISHGCLYEKGYIIIPEIKLFSVLFWWTGTKKNASLSFGLIYGRCQVYWAFESSYGINYMRTN